MLKPTYPYYLANQAVQANTDLEVTDKYTGEVATRRPLMLASPRRSRRRMRAAEWRRSSVRRCSNIA